MKPSGIFFAALVTGTIVAGCEPAGEATKPQAEAPAVAAPAPAETLGFVISGWREAIPDDVTGGCPDGLNITEFEHLGIDEKVFRARAKELGGYAEAEKEMLPADACKARKAVPDPGFHTFDGPAIVAGLDLDGEDSSTASDTTACPHDDFTSPDGTTGIDNQYWRAYGCVAAHQPGGLADRMYASGNFIREGIPMLVEITGVNDRRNDDEVEIRILSSADTVSLDANNKVIPQLSMRAHEEARYRNTPAKARIKDGILTSEPTDVYLRFKQQVIDNEFYYKDARIRAEILEDGSLRGVIGFYWDTDNLHDVMNNHMIGENFHSGRVAASTRGYMCAGMDYALDRMADGHPDPETGKCTSLSGANLFEAIPAFVIMPEA